MLKTQKVFWWRTGCANTEGKLRKEPDGEMGSIYFILTYMVGKVFCREPIFEQILQNSFIFSK